MTLEEAVGAAVRRALRKDGLSQAEFARRVGMSEKHVSLVLQGKAGATLETLDDWAEALGRRWFVSMLTDLSEVYRDE